MPSPSCLTLPYIWGTLLGENGGIQKTPNLAQTEQLDVSFASSYSEKRTLKAGDQCVSYKNNETDTPTNFKEIYVPRKCLA